MDDAPPFPSSSTTKSSLDDIDDGPAPAVNSNGASVKTEPVVKIEIPAGQPINLKVGLGIDAPSSPID